MWVARVSVFLYILVFFEVGAVLIASPWFMFWSENHFLAYLEQQFDAPALVSVVSSPATRWAVTGLGVVNIFLGVWEAFHFKRLVRFIVQSSEDSPNETVAVSGNRPESL
jgi:hypothetical protein